jgi:predicted glycosyltransferase
MPQHIIWIDLDNTPHVPFFRPIIRELQVRGYKVALSARDAFQVCDLADLYGMKYEKVGRHHGRNPIRKVLGLIWRSLMLLPLVLRHRPAIALSHGSRSQILLCNVLRIPTVMIMDYEHARTPLLLSPRWEIVPSSLARERLQCQAADRILSYGGIKEDVYAPEFEPDESLSATLGIDKDRVIVTVRPPATEAHYHSPESDTLFVAFMELACANDKVQVILLPRNGNQEAMLRKSWPHWFEGRSVVVPGFAVDGLNLLWHSDLVVSGGGTMNREAAALGLPVYSIFRGPIGEVDRQLQREGRLIMIESVEAIRQRIALQQRDRRKPPLDASGSSALTAILDHIEAIMAKELSPESETTLRRVN